MLEALREGELGRFSEGVLQVVAFSPTSCLHHWECTWSWKMLPFREADLLLTAVLAASTQQCLPEVGLRKAQSWTMLCSQMYLQLGLCTSSQP